MMWMHERVGKLDSGELVYRYRRYQNWKLSINSAPLNGEGKPNRTLIKLEVVLEYEGWDNLINDHAVLLVKCSGCTLRHGGMTNG
jgi:hypothetical protein